jgi:hypothetical protein
MRENRQTALFEESQYYGGLAVARRELSASQAIQTAHNRVEDDLEKAMRPTPEERKTGLNLVREYFDSHPHSNCQVCDYSGLADCSFISQGSCAYAGLALTFNSDSRTFGIRHEETDKSRVRWTRINPSRGAVKSEVIYI